MIALYIILGIILLIVLILCIPVGAEVGYDQSFTASARVAFIKIPLYPAPPKKPKKEKKKKPEKDKKEEEEKPPEPKKKGENPLVTFYRNNGFDGVMDVVRKVNKLLDTAFRRILRSFVIDEVYIDIMVAKGDAAETAIEYGKTCAAAFPVFGSAVSRLRVRKYNLNVEPDFLARYGDEAFFLRLHTLPIRLVNAGLALVFGALFKIILKYFVHLGSKKGKKGAEPKNGNIPDQDNNIKKEKCTPDERTVSSGDPVGDDRESASVG